MQKWEYQQLKDRDEDALLSQLNTLGQEGWELVSLQWRIRLMEQRNDYDRSFDGEVVAYLKRPAQDPPTERTFWAV